MRVIRLAGPPGVGKSTVAWSVATGAAADGVVVGFVDVDQLGMCYPAPEGDPERWHLKERALHAVVRVHAAAGTAVLVVSGVASPDAGPTPVPGHDLVALWLDAPAGVLADRLAVRGWSPDRTATVVATGTAESGRLVPGWRRVDTGSHPLAGTVARVRRASGTEDGVPANDRRIDPTGDTVVAEDPSADAVDAVAAVDTVTAVLSDDVGVRTPVLRLRGPRCVGASSVAWALVSARWRAGERTGFVDVAQLSFAWNGPVAARLGVDCAEAVLRVFDAVGAGRHVVVEPIGTPGRPKRTAPAGSPASTEPGVAFAPGERTCASRSAPDGASGRPTTRVRLDAGEVDLAERVRSRTVPGGPVLAGDDLIGASDAAVARVVARAVRERDAPLCADEDVIDTSGCDLAGSARRVSEAVDARRRGARG
jgi:broad-specificity NMP kinase